MPWRAKYGTVKLLTGYERVHRIGCSPHYFLIYLFVSEVQSLHFTPELVTFRFRWPHYPPPHLHCSLTQLPAPVTQFLCLLLTGFPTQISLYSTVPQMEADGFTFMTNGPAACKWRQQSPSMLYQQCSTTIYIYTVEPWSIVPVTIVFPHVPFAIFGPE
jgi:hypothetical protein